MQPLFGLRFAIALPHSRVERPTVPAGLVFGTTDAVIHLDHAVVGPLLSAAVFLARLDHWERVPGGELLADTEPWNIVRYLRDRLVCPKTTPFLAERIAERSRLAAQPAG